MEEYARHWPQYGFDKNYGHVDSEVHRAGLQVCAKPCVCAACTLLCSCIRKGLRVTQRRCFRPKTAAASQALRQHPRLHTSSARQQCCFHCLSVFHCPSILSLCHRPLTISSLSCHAQAYGASPVHRARFGVWSQSEMRSKLDPRRAHLPGGSRWRGGDGAVGRESSDEE